MPKFAKLLLFFVAALSPLLAEKRALLIGIGQYIPNQGMKNLEGSIPDVDVFSSTLIDDFGFKRENVIILKDKDASRQGILNAFDKLVASVSKGDYVVIFYSGHGTSPQDGAWKERLPVDADTGALIPSDFRRGKTMQEVTDRLIIGRRDLRPRLEKLDGKATVFGILDTCFSANLMKDVLLRGTPRSVSVSDLLVSGSAATRSMDDDIRQETTPGKPVPAPAPYPYHTVAWISAAQAGEQAVDLDRRVTDRDKTATVDGNPHGQFTNAVLKGLGGAADRNHDGVITHAELFEYVSQQAKNWSHSPAWSANDNNHDFPKMAVLAGRTKALVVTNDSPHAGKVCAQVEGNDPGFLTRLGKLPGIAVNCKPADLVLRQTASGWRIFNSGGVLITDKDLAADAALQRVGAEPGIRSLIDRSYSNQRSNLSLSLLENGVPSHREIFTPGSVINPRLQSDDDVWPMVVDVDVTGEVTVLYPRKSLADVVKAGKASDLGANGASCPCGLEYMKAFAFAQKPAGYESWIGKSFSATSPELNKLLALVQSGQGETTLRIVTKDAGQ
jgi:hypothetical protein